MRQSEKNRPPHPGEDRRIDAEHYQLPTLKISESVVIHVWRLESFNFKGTISGKLAIEFSDGEKTVRSGTATVIRSEAAKVSDLESSLTGLLHRETGLQVDLDRARAEIRSLQAKLAAATLGGTDAERLRDLEAAGRDARDWLVEALPEFTEKLRKRMPAARRILH